MSGVVASCAAIARVPPFEFTINGTGLASSTNVRTAAVAAGWDGKAPVVCTLTGTFNYPGGNSPDAALVVAGAFPGSLTVINKAVVTGKSGAGGRGGDQYNSPNAAGVGQPGGTALLVSTPCSFDNQGSLRGGGGGGGGGGAYTATTGSPPNTYGGGGGGAGRGAGPYTLNKMPGGPGGAGTFAGANGGDGSATSNGGGGIGGSSGTGGNGGNGGTWGQPGTSGVSKSYPGAAGGRGGYAVDGNSYVTWINTGTLTGGIV
jgi:hypothetical protein